MPSRLDLVGQRFGRLTALSCDFTRPRLHWTCVCDCGNQTSVSTTHLRAGRQISCGCYKAEVSRDRCFRHGHFGTPTYETWAQMIARCRRPGASSFEHYGGRGIKVCDRWRESFVNFLADMGERPEGMSIERDDVNGNYELGNCRWATSNEQANNRRDTVRVTLHGEEMSLTQACRELGISYARTQSRMTRLGWTFERASTQPRVIGHPRAKQLQAA